MHRLFCKLFRKELKIEFYEVFSVVMCVLIPALLAIPLTSIWGTHSLCYNELIQYFPELDMTMFAVFVAISAWIESKKMSGALHVRILRNTPRTLGIIALLIIFASLISILISPCLLYLNMFIICAEGIFLMISGVSIYSILSPQWDEEVHENEEKDRLVKESIFKLKHTFREFCQILDDNSLESFAFYGQVDGQKMLSHKQKKFLKELYSKIDNTKCGIYIHNPEHELEKLLEIIKLIEGTETKDSLQ